VIDERTIEVWSLDLESPPAPFAEVLTEAERAQAARFHFEHLRRHYTVARGALRLLLGRYLSADPALIALRTGPKGKPFVDAPLSFNVSHSGDLALLAFTRGPELGIDVEQFRPMPDLLPVARRFFCAEETEELMALPPPARQRAFFACWTRKEAYIKATGNGLHTPLDQFRVTLRPGEAARFVHIANDDAGAWTLHDVVVPEGYAAAVAYRAGGGAREIAQRVFEGMPRVQ
jgi:4'-phosphopantetheinyl transferase